jgi:hypothetical protein
MLSPGESFPLESPLPSATSAPVSPSSVTKHGLTPGIIAGIVVATTLVGVIGICICVFFLRRTKEPRNNTLQSRSPGTDGCDKPEPQELP